MSDEVIDQIVHVIHTGIYEVGDKLPRIDELAAIMQVSIASASEAVRVLTRAKVLTVRRGAGGGVVVASSVIPSAILAPPHPTARDLREVVEARRPVELELGRLAARRATEADVLDMRAAIALQRRSFDDLASWSFGNFRFHYAIGRAARSDLLFHMQTQVTKELARLLSDWTPRDLADPEATVAEHEAILTCLMQHDILRTEAAVGSHLRELEALAGLEVEGD